MRPGRPKLLHVRLSVGLGRIRALQPHLVCTIRANDVPAPCAVKIERPGCCARGQPKTLDRLSEKPTQHLRMEGGSDTPTLGLWAHEERPYVPGHKSNREPKYAIILLGYPPAAVFFYRAPQLFIGNATPSEGVLENGVPHVPENWKVASDSLAHRKGERHVV